MIKRLSGILLSFTIGNVPTGLQCLEAERCLAARTILVKLMRRADNIENDAANKACPEHEFKKYLNTSSDWAWVIDTSARQECRDRWRAKQLSDYTAGTSKTNYFDEKMRNAKDISDIIRSMKERGCPFSDIE